MICYRVEVREHAESVDASDSKLSNDRPGSRKVESHRSELQAGMTL